MGSCLLFLLTLLGGSDELVVEIPAPEFTLSGGVLEVDGCDYLVKPGAPRLPCKNITLALRPGAIVDSVSFSGERQIVGKVNVPAARPALPMTDGLERSQIEERFESQKRRFYSSDGIYPTALGTLRSQGALRKYTLIDIACYFFAWQPLSRRLHYAPTITVTVRYSMPEPDHQRARFFDGLKNDTTFDRTARSIIDNWPQASQWYTTRAPQRAEGYCIIIPAAMQNAVDALVSHRQSQGYDVTVVTRQSIEANVSGVDVQQKIRHYLRANVAHIAFVLLVGEDFDMPWRSLVPFNENPNGPQGNPDIAPIPSDLYFSELTDPDGSSWDVDGDGYYGEVYDDDFNLVGDDDPDHYADVHLGRIPFSSPTMISDICAKTIAFDTNKDRSYKTASLLAGGMYYFENENYGGLPRIDGADFMEDLLDMKVFDPSKATTLYEKSGLNYCTYPCTAPLTQNNQIGFWQRKGIMYECHHGNAGAYARKYWAWDDGDAIPENHEFEWPLCLEKNDVYQLDNEYPATSYLRSCLCGKPEVTSLGAMLLYRGSSAVVASSRIAWLSFADMGGMPFHFYERLMGRTDTCRGLVGAAHDLSRIDFMETSGFWIIPYHYNLFGDPALRQFGRLIDRGERDYLPSK